MPLFSHWSWTEGTVPYRVDHYLVLLLLLLPHTHWVVAFNKLNGRMMKKGTLNLSILQVELNINLSNCGWRFHPASLCDSLSLLCASYQFPEQVDATSARRWKSHHIAFRDEELLLAEERSNYYSKASSWWRGKKEDRTGTENKRLKRSTRQSLTLKKTLPISARGLMYAN